MLSVLATAFFLSVQAEDVPVSVTCHTMAVEIDTALRLAPERQNPYAYRYAGLSLSEAVRVFGWNANDMVQEIQVRTSAYLLIAEFIDGWDQDSLVSEFTEHRRRMIDIMENNPEQENLIRLMLREKWDACAEQERSNPNWENAFSLSREDFE